MGKHFTAKSMWTAYFYCVLAPSCDKDSCMKLILIALSLFLPLAAFAQQAEKPTSLKGVLLEQLKTTHNQKEWFVPANVAVEGLTAEQAKWTDGKGDHSIGQLAAHITFWDKEQLAKFKGEPP